MMFWYGGGWALWEVALMWLGMIVVWGLIIWAIYALVASVMRRPPAGHGHLDARRTLDHRLASGEIGADEYRKLRDLLDASHTHEGYDDPHDGRLAGKGSEQG